MQAPGLATSVKPYGVACWPLHGVVKTGILQCVQFRIAACESLTLPGGSEIQGQGLRTICTIRTIYTSVLTSSGCGPGTQNCRCVIGVLLLRVLHPAGAPSATALEHPAGASLAASTSIQNCANLCVARSATWYLPGLESKLAERHLLGTPRDLRLLRKAIAGGSHTSAYFINSLRR